MMETAKNNSRFNQHDPLLRPPRANSAEEVMHAFPNPPTTPTPAAVKHASDPVVEGFERDGLAYWCQRSILPALAAGMIGFPLWLSDSTTVVAGCIDGIAAAYLFVTTAELVVRLSK
jgi:hypothetical protein